jgi:CheY-like chemotaxis protein
MSAKKILIVDDETNIRKLIRSILEKEKKYEFEEASNGREAQEKVKNFCPDLIVLDINMPGEGGYDACLHIRNQVDKKRVKIIGVSGLSGKIGDAIMTALGADYFFEKPFNNEQFKSKVAELLGEH